MLVCSRCFNAFSTVDRCLIDGTRLVKPEQTPLTRTVGRYELQGLIGEGRTSRIFRALDRPTNRPVALKLLHGELARDRALAAKVVLRAKSYSKLDPGRFVPVLDADLTAQGLAYVARELVEGQSLAASLHFTGARPPRASATVLHGIAACLSKLHWAGQPHGDLRPGAVMLSGPGERVRLFEPAAVDLLREAPPEVRAGLGEFEPVTYAAPEVLAGGPPTTLSDLYVLGVMLYALLIGSPPFKTREGHLDEPVPGMALEYAGLAALARALLEKDPAKRPQSADAVLARIDRLGLIEPPVFESVPPQPAPGSEHEATGRGRRYAGAGLVAAAVAALAGGLWVYRAELLPVPKEASERAESGPELAGGPSAAFAASRGPGAQGSEAVEPSATHPTEREAPAAAVALSPPVLPVAPMTPRPAAPVTPPPVAPVTPRPQASAAATSPASGDSADGAARTAPASKAEARAATPTSRPSPSPGPSPGPSFASTSTRATLAAPSDALATAFQQYDAELGRALADGHFVWADLAAAAPVPARQWGRWYKREPIGSMKVLTDTFGALREAIRGLTPAAKTSTTST